MMDEPDGPQPTTADPVASKNVRGDDERARILFYIGVGAGVLFVVTAVIVVLTQTLAPLAGLEPGDPDPVVIGSMLIWAGISFGMIPAAAIMRARGKDDQ